MTLFWLPRSLVAVPPKSYDCCACHGSFVPALAPAAGDTSTKEAQHDERSYSRYRGLRQGAIIPITQDDGGLLVRPESARAQIDKEAKTEPTGVTENGGSSKTSEGSTEAAASSSAESEQERPRRYHGTVRLDSARVGRDAGRIADEVISHLVGLVGANVSVTLEIEADLPSGVPDHVVRTVTENGRTLKFQSSSGFENE